jgi:hypothetical protein
MAMRAKPGQLTLTRIIMTQLPAQNVKPDRRRHPEARLRPLHPEHL